MKIAIQGSNGKYVCAEQGGGIYYGGPAHYGVAFPGVAPLYCNRDNAAEWETFEMESNSNGTVSFKTHNGYYITAEEGGGYGVSTNRKYSDGPGPWEMFWETSYGGILCWNKVNYWCCEQSSDSHINASRTEVGIWEQFKIIKLEHDVEVDEATLRRHRYDYCGPVLPIEYGPVREGGHIFFSPGYVVENDYNRQLIRDYYKQHGWTHLALNLYSSSTIYRDMYPNWDDTQINKFLEELWEDNIIPLCSCLPDGSNQPNLVADPDLVRVGFWWEDPAPIEYPRQDETNKFWIVNQAYPKAILYWHNPPNQDAPYIDYGKWGLDPSEHANPVVWNYLVRNNNVKGLLFQGQAWEDSSEMKGWERSVAVMKDYVPRFHGDMYGLPERLDIIDFEETAYYLFNMDGSTDQALLWTDQIRASMGGDLDGYGNSA